MSLKCLCSTHTPGVDETDASGGESGGRARQFTPGLTDQTFFVFVFITKVGQGCKGRGGVGNFILVRRTSTHGAYGRQHIGCGCIFGPQGASTRR